MTVSLDSAYVATCLQGLEGLAGILAKARTHCETTGLDAEELTGARLAPDMWPFAKQVFEVGHHSARAVAGIRVGVFGPELQAAPADFAALEREITDSMTTMRAVEPGELDAIAQRDMRFEFRDMRMDFTVENFLFSFSLPNFFFHLTTAYAILRSRGLQIGKGEFLGQVRCKR